MGSDDGKPLRGPLQLKRAFDKLPMKAKLGLGTIAGVLGIILLYFVIEEHDTLFVMSESCHVLGICVLIYKLSTTKTCAGRVGASALNSMQTGLHLVLLAAPQGFH